MFISCDPIKCFKYEFKNTFVKDWEIDDEENQGQKIIADGGEIFVLKKRLLHKNVFK
jgi:hypothetical protein